MAKKYDKGNWRIGSKMVKERIVYSIGDSIGLGLHNAFPLTDLASVKRYVKLRKRDALALDNARHGTKKSIQIALVRAWGMGAKKGERDGQTRQL